MEMLLVDDVSINQVIITDELILSDSYRCVFLIRTFRAEGREYEVLSKFNTIEISISTYTCADKKEVALRSLKVNMNQSEILVGVWPLDRKVSTMLKLPKDIVYGFYLISKEDELIDQIIADIVKKKAEETWIEKCRGSNS